MKKTILIFLVLFATLFLFSGIAPKARAQQLTTKILCDESSADGKSPGKAVNINFKNGLVPCGRTCKDDNDNQVNCGTLACGPNKDAPCYNPYCRCELEHTFILILNIYNFIVRNIATPLAGLLVVIGGIMILVSGGNPNLAHNGRRILWGAGIGVILILGSWLIINIFLKAIGYTGPWSNPFTL